MTDWVEIVALLGGPVVAVGLSLWREEQRQRRDRKMSVLRQFAVVKAHPGDPAFSNAVNLIPIEFGKSDRVMTALEAFNDAANKQHMTIEISNDLLASMMIDLGYRQRAAKQASRSAYVAKGLATQMELNAQVSHSLLKMAQSSEQSAMAATMMAEHVTGKAVQKGAEAQAAPKKLS